MGSQLLKRKIRHAARKFRRYELPDYEFNLWKERRSTSQLSKLHEIHLTYQAKDLLSIPLSEWTIEKLEFLEFLDRIDQEVHRRGCYLLVVYDLKGLQVELYSGASNDMRKRYKEHLACIRRAGRPSARVLHFHRRCHALARRNGPGRYKTLLIPLSHEPDYDQEALDFDESCHIATFGLWQRSNAPPARLTAWKVVQSMKLDSGDKLPDGWNGANREIPFNPTRGRRKWL